MIKQILKVSPYFILAMIVAGALAFIDGFLFIKMGALFDIVMTGDPEAFRAGSIQLLGIAAVLVVVAITNAFTRALYKKKANLKLKSYYVNGVFKKNISEFHKENNAKYISSLTNDFNLLEVNLVDSMNDIGIALLNFMSGIWVISTVTPWILVVMLGVGVINVLLSKVTSKPVAKHMQERSDLFDDYTAYIKEVLSAFHIIKSNNLQARIETSFNEKSNKVQQKGYTIDKYLTYIQAIQNVNISCTMYAILGVCGYMAIQGVITIGGAMIVIQGVQKVMWPIFLLGETMPKVFTVKDLIKKIQDTLEDEDKYEESLEFEDFKENIVLQNVSFAYDETDILQGIDLEIKKGGKYLIVGPSGGGKSTLLKLLRKYFNPTNGDILIDGKKLRDIKKQSYYSQVANVEQQVFIFEDTLRNNITLYKDYDDEAITEAINKAGLKEFVKSLPDGLETMIYDNGKTISGGERSRIVIARGLLAKASIIFLDEAFAALDMERAKEIESSILALDGVTVINVSHVVFKENKSQYDHVIKVKHQKIKVA